MRSQESRTPSKKKKRKKPFPQGAVEVDFETNGLEFYYGGRPFLCGLEDEEGTVIISRPGDSNWPLVKRIIEDPNIVKVSHNAKYELLMSHAMGWNPAGVWHCTLLMAAMVYEYTQLSMQALSRKHFGRDHKNMVKDWLTANARAFKKEHNRAPNYSDVPNALIEEYLELDLDDGMRFYWLFKPALERAGTWELYEVERKLLANEVVPMELRGLKIDRDYCFKTALEFNGVMAKLHKKMVKHSKIKDLNPNSRQQVATALTKLNIDTGEVGKDGVMLTNRKVLAKAGVSSNPFVKSLGLWKGYKKIVGTYLVPYTQKASHNILHPSFWQLGEDEGIKTGRFSCKNPNFQNIPSDAKNNLPAEIVLSVREAVVPRKGHAFVFGDYSQIELVLFFWYAGATRMLNKYVKGEDIYRANCYDLFEGFADMNATQQDICRRDSKTISLALQYGMGLELLASILKKPVAEAKRLKALFFQKFPDLRQFMMDAQRDLIVNGFVEDPFGKRYHVPKDLGFKACSTMTQGFAAGIMKRGMIRVGPKIRALAPTAGIVNIIHDEIKTEVPINKVREAADALKKYMPPSIDLLGIPIRVKVKVAYKSWKHSEEVPSA